MVFWQAFGIILGSVLTGIVLGLAVIYVISKIQKRPMFFPRKSTPTPAQKLIAETINAPAKASSNSTLVRWDNLGELFKDQKSQMKQIPGLKLIEYKASDRNQLVPPSVME